MFPADNQEFEGSHRIGIEQIRGAKLGRWDATFNAVAAFLQQHGARYPSENGADPDERRLHWCVPRPPPAAAATHEAAC